MKREPLMRPLAPRAWLRALMLALVLLAAAMAHAQPRNIDNRQVTAADVAAAIRNSPNASAWLRANADAVANLAMFESGGRLGIYNGSCCFGVLQMNRTNIRQIARVSPEVFRTWSLQDQVNAWARLTTQAMNNQVVRSLIALGTFDGRRVDGNLVLACVQMGVGNCQRMIRSGRCDGFADRNGTTICHMADRIANGGAAPSAPPGPADTAPGSTPGHGGGTRPGVSPDLGCVRDAGGGCMSMSQSMQAGFEAGSGVRMERLRSVIQMLLAAITFLVVGSAMTGVWQNFARGGIAKADLLLYMQRGLIIVGMVFVAMSVL